MASSMKERISSPIAEIPPDLIALIFRHANNSIGRKTRNPPSTSAPPLQVAQVCRRWREVALALPELWDTLALANCGADPAMVLSSYFVKQWFRHSSGSGTSLHFLWTTDETVEGRNNRASIVSDFNQLDTLESLILRVNLRRCELYDLNHISCCFQNANNLRKLYFAHDYFYDIPSLPLPWSELTHIILLPGLDFPHDWLLILQHCNNLEYGVFELDGPDTTISFPTKRFVVPRLRDLTLETSFVGLPNFLCGAQVPNLKKLRLSAILGPADWQINTSSPWLTDQLRGLESLSLITYTSTGIGPGLVDILQLAPQIEELDLHLPEQAVADVFRALVRAPDAIPDNSDLGPSHSPLLVRLHTLKLDIRRKLSPQTFDELYTFLSLRFRFALNQLKRLQVYSYQRDLASMEELADILGLFAGLDFEIQGISEEGGIHWSQRLTDEEFESEWGDGLVEARDYSGKMLDAEEESA